MDCFVDVCVWTACARSNEEVDDPEDNAERKSVVLMSIIKSCSMALISLDKPDVLTGDEGTL